MKKITLVLFSLCLGIAMNAQIVLTQNIGNTITAGNSVACPSGDNNWARNFILSDYSVDAASEFVIASGDFGIQSNAAAGNATVSVYSSDANFPTSFSEANILGSQVVAIPANANGTIVNFEFDTPVVVPAGTVAVLYVVATPPAYVMFIGGTASETAEGYLKSATCSVTTFVTPSSITFPDANFYMTLTQEDDLGVAENVLASSMSLYPNPTNGDLNIKFSRSVGTATVDIITVSGQKVLNATVEGFGTSSLGTNKLASGIYFAQISTASETSTVKFIKN